MPVLSDDFVPALGFSDGHAQTVLASRIRPSLKLPLVRRRFETRDRDFFDVDVLEGNSGAPTVLVLHGLEGSSQAGYVQQVLAGAHERGWHGWALNARACSGVQNKQAASYSSGDYRDAKWLLEQVLTGPVLMVGFSLGGSVTLNLLAQVKPRNVVAAAAVSAPFDLVQCAKWLDSSDRFAPVYLHNFLVTMKPKALWKARRFPEVLDAEAIKAAKTIRDFDHVVTARVFGFESAEDYYTRCSAGPQLANIETPTLLLSAEDDAIAPPKFLPGSAYTQPNLDVLVTRHGGHVGFMGGSVLRPKFWAEQRVLQWLDTRV